MNVPFTFFFFSRDFLGGGFYSIPMEVCMYVDKPSLRI